ncbi:MAG: CDGSH iron-sulfur domain-containing protein [Gemmatimonadota bacterium]|nr:CDGSH iron-sulfur domain-containing protein [Gemmatimonadota bacterium]
MTEETIITPKENGPFHVKGSFRVVLSDGTELDVDEQAWLCRCGDSSKKPFCDGTHSKSGFVCDNAEMKASEG